MNSDDNKQDDVIIEPLSNSHDDEDSDDSVVAEENTNSLIRSLRERLGKCESEKTEYLTGWQRAKADNINARKREEESRKEFSKYANENLIHELIPTLESYNMALANKDTWEKVDKTWRVGIEYIFSQLKKTLEQNGLIELDPIGENYDAMRDESVRHDKTDDKSKSGKITEVISKGYSLNGKVIKPPKVAVGE